MSTQYLPTLCGRKSIASYRMSRLRRSRQACLRRPTSFARWPKASAAWGSETLSSIRSWPAEGPLRRTLLAPDAVSLLKRLLLPVAAVVTPNAAEAAALCGVEVNSLDAAREAARRIAGFGPGAVVIKGGHLHGPQAIDLLFHDGVFTEFAAPRAAIGVIHGTGCTFASAIAAGLANGCGVATAVERAKRYVTGAIEHSFSIGHGARILNHFWVQPSPR